MKRHALKLIPIMLSCAATPAMADYVRLGSVDVGFRTDRDSAWSRFGGGMEGLRLIASSSDIMCRRILVTFGDGTQQNVFHGLLPEENPVDVDLRGGSRRVSRIDFTCRSDQLNGGRIFVAADVGRFRAEWQRSPDWATTWSRYFTAGPAPAGGDQPAYWVPLGREHFGAHRDSEWRFGGLAGRGVDRISLRAIDSDARCLQVQATFGNGHTRQLDASGLAQMQQGRVYRLDLPGGDRNVVRVDLTCRALGDRDVTIEISARK